LHSGAGGSGEGAKAGGGGTELRANEIAKAWGKQGKGRRQGGQMGGLGGPGASGNTKPAKGGHAVAMGGAVDELRRT